MTLEIIGNVYWLGDGESGKETVDQSQVLKKEKTTLSWR
jgi:hypothetical protein